MFYTKQYKMENFMFHLPNIFQSQSLTDGIILIIFNFSKKNGKLLFCTRNANLFINSL